MINILYRFKIEGYADDAGEYEHEGIVYGETMTDAVSVLDDWYEDEMCVLTIERATENDEPYLLKTEYEEEMIDKPKK